MKYHKMEFYYHKRIIYLFFLKIKINFIYFKLILIKIKNLIIFYLIKQRIKILNKFSKFLF